MLCTLQAVPPGLLGNALDLAVGDKAAALPALGEHLAADRALQSFCLRDRPGMVGPALPAPFALECLAKLAEVFDRFMSVSVLYFFFFFNSAMIRSSW